MTCQFHMPLFVLLSLSNICLCLQHFVCAKCEKPFLGHRHYERKGLAYCETHYNQVRKKSMCVYVYIYNMIVYMASNDVFEVLFLFL